MTDVLTNLQVELEAVRPDGAGQAEEEYRLAVTLLPLRLRIDQNIVLFLQDFIAGSQGDRGTNERSNAGEASVVHANVQPHEGASVLPHVQTSLQLSVFAACVLSTTHITVLYKVS